MSRAESRTSPVVAHTGSGTVPDHAIPRPWHDLSRSVPERVESLLAAMTLEQKAAQLGSYWRPRGPANEQVAPLAGVPTDRRHEFADCIRHGLGQLTRVFGSVPLSAAQGVADLRV